MNLSPSPLLVFMLAAGLICYLAAFGLHLLMVFMTNKGLPVDDQLPYSLSLGRWNRVAKEYARFYPRSHVYQFGRGFAIATLIFALGIFVMRFWGLASGR